MVVVRLGLEPGSVECRSRSGEEVVSVQRWAEIRRMRFVEGLAIREIRRRTGLHRDTIRRALASSTPPRYARAGRGSKLDGFREEIHGLLRGDPLIESQRIRELLAEQGY